MSQLTRRVAALESARNVWHRVMVITGLSAEEISNAEALAEAERCEIVWVETGIRHAPGTRHEREHQSSRGETLEECAASARA